MTTTDENKPAEILLYEFLREKIESTTDRESIWYELELHDTIWQPIKTPLALRISDTISDIVPGPGGGLREWDAEITLVCYALVAGNEYAQRSVATQQVFDLQSAVCELLYTDQDLGGRVCGITVRRTPRSYDSLDAKPYAVVNIPLVINPSGYGTE